MNGVRIFSLSPKVSFQALGQGEGAVVLTLESGQLYTCNDTTTAFLSALDGKRTFDTVTGVLEDEFEVDREELRADLTALATHLLDEGVIV
jgi:pyrroloquinoline quinone biosynthesis protein D